MGVVFGILKHVDPLSISVAISSRILGQAPFGRLNVVSFVRTFGGPTSRLGVGFLVFGASVCGVSVDDFRWFDSRFQVGDPAEILLVHHNID